MHFLLKMCKHGLTIQSCAKLLQEIIDQICLFFFIFGLFHQIMDQQCLVTGRCHFCNKYAISGIQIILGMIGIPGMQSVPHFMGQRKYMV